MGRFEFDKGVKSRVPTDVIGIDVRVWSATGLLWLRYRYAWLPVHHDAVPTCRFLKTFFQFLVDFGSNGTMPGESMRKYQKVTLSLGMWK